MSSKTSAALALILLNNMMFTATHAATDDKPTEVIDHSEWPTKPGIPQELLGVILDYVYGYTRGADIQLATWKYLHLKLADTLGDEISHEADYYSGNEFEKDWTVFTMKKVKPGAIFNDLAYAKKSYARIKTIFNGTYVHPCLDKSKLIKRVRETKKSQRLQRESKENHEWISNDATREIQRYVTGTIIEPWEDWGKERIEEFDGESGKGYFKGGGKFGNRMKPITRIRFTALHAKDHNYFVFQFGTGRFREPTRVVIRLIDLFNAFQELHKDANKVFKVIKTIHCPAVVEIHDTFAVPHKRNFLTSVMLTITNSEEEFQKLKIEGAPKHLQDDDAKEQPPRPRKDN